MRRALLALFFMQAIGVARSECSTDQPCPPTKFCNFNEGASGLCETCTTCTGEAPSGEAPSGGSPSGCGDCGLLDAGVADCANMCVGAHGCMPGSSCPDSVDCQLQSHCEGCDAGKVSDGILPCTVCGEQGQAASSDQSRCESCSPGKQPSADKSRCESCVGATYSAFGIECAHCDTCSTVTCSVHNAVNTKKSSCAPCGPGHEPDAERTACVETFVCPAGSYCHHDTVSYCENDHDCLQCPAGQVMAGTHDVPCHRCRNDNEVANAAQSQCVLCGEGMFPLDSRAACGHVPHILEVTGHIYFAAPLHKVNADRAGFEAEFADAMVAQFLASHNVIIAADDVTVISILVACDFKGRCQQAKVDYFIKLLSDCVEVEQLADAAHAGDCDAAAFDAFGQAHNSVLSEAAAGRLTVAAFSTVDPYPTVPSAPTRSGATAANSLAALLCVGVLCHSMLMRPSSFCV